MSQINTNISSILAQRVLGQQNKSLATSLERLSTGLAINRGADNPAGLIASENLRSEKASISAAIGNAERADTVMNIAEGGLQEISNLLIEVQSLVGESANDAGLSTEEKEANQLQIDSILQTIDRIASSTSFQGTKLLNGNFDFNVTGQAARVSDYTINGAKLADSDTRAVDVVITASAQHGSLFVSAGATAIDLGSAGDALVFEVAGSKGAREFSFASGTALSAIAAQVNTFTSVTGVSAVASAAVLEFKSDAVGDSEFVSFSVSDHGGLSGGEVFTASALNENAIGTSAGTFGTLTNAVKDSGQDVGAVINGIAATSNGSTARINSDFLDLELNLTTSGTQTLGAFTALTVTGGGAKFNLGPNVDLTNQVSVGIENVAARNLGNVSDGFLDDLGAGKSSNVVDGDVETAQTIVNSAIGKVSSLRGRLGAVQKNVIGATIRSLGVALENTSAAESAIRDTDFAAETAELTRRQILVQAASQTLSISNAQPSNVLGLLR